MNGDLVVVRVDKRDRKCTPVRERGVHRRRSDRASSAARIARWSAASTPSRISRSSCRSTSASTPTSSSTTTRTMDARDGEMVNVEIDRYPDRTTHFARGRVVEVLGFIGEPGVDIEVVIRKLHIPHDFPPDVLREAEPIPTEVPPEEIAQARRSARPQHRHDRRRDGEGLRRRRRSAAAAERQLPPRRAHRRRRALRDRGERARSRSLRARHVGLLSRGAPCRCCRSGCRTASAR